MPFSVKRAGHVHLFFPEGLAIWSNFCDKLRVTEGQVCIRLFCSKTLDRKKKGWCQVDAINRMQAQAGSEPGPRW